MRHNFLVTTGKGETAGSAVFWETAHVAIWQCGHLWLHDFTTAHNACKGCQECFLV